MDKYSDEDIIAICPHGTKGECVQIGGLVIALPATPPKEEIAGHEKPNHMQMWERVSMPEELSRIKSMDEWSETPREFRQKFLRISRRSFAVGVTAFGLQQR